MQRQLLITKDGSHTISVPEMNVTYHSIHGAIQESKHVFIEAGLHASGRLAHPEAFPISSNPLPACRWILEIGFGTALNALLTLIESEKTGTKIYYETLEPYPLNEQERASLNYCDQLNRPDLQNIFNKMHACEWEKEIPLTENFILIKRKQALADLEPLKLLNFFELVYFDAFAPNAQPELWTTKIFKKLYDLMMKDGILVTYCSKGDVRRAMQAAGFVVEKIPGPPGKREMVRARR